MNCGFIMTFSPFCVVVHEDRGPQKSKIWYVFPRSAWEHTIIDCLCVLCD
jgi:hypothetical protein